MSPTPAAGLLPLFTQLGTGSPTAGDDCAAVTILNVIRQLSDGKVGPRRQSEVAHWVRQVRVWGGAPTSRLAAKARGRDNAGMLLRGEVLTAYRSVGMALEFRKAHLPAPRASYLYRADWKAVPTALAQGHAVHLPVDYGVLRAGDAPTGSLTFSDGHSLCLFEYEQDRRGRVWTADGDPLADGRRKDVPDGWQDARLPDFQKAASAWTGAKGLTTFIDVRRG